MTCRLYWKAYARPSLRPRLETTSTSVRRSCSWNYATSPSVPGVTNDNVREMLIQHILTKDIFLRVFAEDQFHRENNVARQLDALEGTFFTGSVRRDASTGCGPTTVPLAALPTRSPSTVRSSSS